jgi:polysaccharide export outer membrane protein
MYKKRICWRRLISFTKIVVTTCFITSCVSTKHVAYFNQAIDLEIASKSELPDPIIQKGDFLDIKITSLNQEASQLFNNSNPGSVLHANLLGTLGYQVDMTGSIQIQYIGYLKAEGLTKLKLKDTIVKLLVNKKLLIDPVVTIRFLNFKVTVLGEVAHPGVQVVMYEKVTILEALAMAGDMTIYGKRDNVLVMRQEKDKKVFKRINLLNEALVNSPYYYLQPNDIVYVEPNKNKVFASSRFVTLLPAILSGLSLLFIILTRTK